MKFSIKDFFSKRDQIRSVLQIWSHLVKIYPAVLFQSDKRNTYFKGKGLCSDFILANRKYSFRNMASFEIGSCAYH